MGDRWHGLRFPFKREAQGLFTDAPDDELIESSIKFILRTQVGEYICLPAFGSQLQVDLFEPNDIIMRQLVKAHVRDALNRWEPRIAVDEISVISDEHEVRLKVAYFLRADQGRLRFFEDSFDRRS